MECLSSTTRTNVSEDPLLLDYAQTRKQQTKINILKRRVGKERNKGIERTSVAILLRRLFESL